MMMLKKKRLLCGKINHQTGGRWPVHQRVESFPSKAGHQSNKEVTGIRSGNLAK